MQANCKIPQKRHKKGVGTIQLCVRERSFTLTNTWNSVSAKTVLCLREHIVLVGVFSQDWHEIQTDEKCRHLNSLSLRALRPEPADLCHVPLRLQATLASGHRQCQGSGANTDRRTKTTLVFQHPHRQWCNGCLFMRVMKCWVHSNGVPEDHPSTILDWQM